MQLTSYRPPAWLKGAHLQTVWPALFNHPPSPAYRREVWECKADGGQLAIDFVDATQKEAPLVVLFHGLEGGSDSNYAKALMHEVSRRGWHGAVAHFRSCGGVPNTSRRAYYAADAATVDWILTRMAERYTVIYAVGISLGGNILARYLGEPGYTIRCRAAAVISAPLDLTASSTLMDVGLHRVLYTRMFLKTLKQKALYQLKHNPGLFERVDLLKAKTFQEFDSLVTAPLHGYRDANDYWRRASGKLVLRNIHTPALIINARNDPFMPANALPGPQDVSPAVTLEQPDEGGHVGFISGSFPGKITWLPRRVCEFFVEHNGQTVAGQHASHLECSSPES